MEQFVEEMRHSFAAPEQGARARRVPEEEFHCSFCDATRRDRKKLISGPRVFICDTCIGDATAVVSHTLRG